LALICTLQLIRAVNFEKFYSILLLALWSVSNLIIEGKARNFKLEG